MTTSDKMKSKYIDTRNVEKVIDTFKYKLEEIGYSPNIEFVGPHPDVERVYRVKLENNSTDVKFFGAFEQPDNAIDNTIDAILNNTENKKVLTERLPIAGKYEIKTRYY